ncbi:hypothetical protein pb186bvf_004571 [Paramecium bursaria]
MYIPSQYVCPFICFIIQQIDQLQHFLYQKQLEYFSFLVQFTFIIPLYYHLFSLQIRQMPVFRCDRLRTQQNHLISNLAIQILVILNLRYK